MNGEQWRERLALEAALDSLIDRAAALESAARAVVAAWSGAYGVGRAIAELERELAALDALAPSVAPANGPTSRADGRRVCNHG